MHILWLKTELLHPVDKGGKIRSYNMLKELKRNHQITYLALDDGLAGPDEVAKSREYCHELVRIPHKHHEKFSVGFYSDLVQNLFSPIPYAIKKYESSGMRQEIIQRSNDGSVDVVICDFLAPAINVPQELKTPSILFQHNVEAMIWKRHFEVQTNALKKRFLHSQWRKMENIEKEMCRRFDSVIAVSVDDRNQMAQEYGVGRVYDVPTGVDTEYFTPARIGEVDPYNVVFTGSMDWLPNEDAIRYYTEQILPIVRRTLPKVTLTVVGRNPYPALLELSKKDPSIIVTGRVEDVRPYMDRASAYVVPLRIGGGTRLKIYEAMAMEKPIVSTSVGAEGLPVTNGRELAIADTPETFAASLIGLLQKPEEALGMGQLAARTVREKFGWNGVAERFAEICEATITAHREGATDLARWSN